MNTTDPEKYLTEVYPKLKNYLLSDSLFAMYEFGAAPNKKPLPNITIGNIFFALRQIENSDIGIKIQNELNHWKVAVEKKGTKEIEFRLRQLTQLYIEWMEDPILSNQQYNYEIRIRAMIELLLNKFGNEQHNSIINLFDQKLKTLTLPGDFVWADKYKPFFQKPDFWFLYQKII